MSYYREGFMLISLAFATHAVYKYFIKRNYKKKQKEVHEVILFSSGTEEIMKSEYSRCMITRSMDRLLYYLTQPQYSIDICMCVFTNMDITNILLKLRYRNVKIRFITDAEMAYASGSCIDKLIQHHIPVRWMKSTGGMEHKFCLIDALSDKGTPILITGSLNWTDQALDGNFENCIVTSQEELVKRYKEEFETLWKLFKPVVM